MNYMQLMIYESKGDWAAALLPRLPDGAALVETRSLDELWQHLDATPTATVALQITVPRAQQIVSALERLDCQYPQTAAVILADRRFTRQSQPVWEAMLREAGAQLFISSPRNVGQLVALHRRRSLFAPFDRLISPDEETSLEDRILENLPWGN